MRYLFAVIAETDDDEEQQWMVEAEAETLEEAFDKAKVIACAS